MEHEAEKRIAFQPGMSPEGAVSGSSEDDRETAFPKFIGPGYRVASSESGDR